MRKYRALFIQYLHEFFTYRLRVVFFTFSQLVSPIVMIAIFSGITNFTAINMNKDQVITYYLFSSIFFLFLNSRVDDFVKLSIQEGGLADSLLKPVNYWLICLIQDLARRIGKLVLGLPIIFLLLIVNINSLSLPVHYNPLMVVFIVSISYLLSFFISFSLGLLAFWLDEVWGFQNLKEVLFIFLGGVALPYQIFPQAMQSFLSWTPFPYLINWPMRLGVNQPIFLEIIIAISWLLFFMFLGFLGWRKGLKKYSGMGVY